MTRWFGAFAIVLATGCRSPSNSPAPDAVAPPAVSLAAAASASAPPATGEQPLTLVMLPAATPLEIDDGWSWLSPLPQGNVLNAVWGTGDRMWAVGKSGTILMHDGKGWTFQASDTDRSLNAVSGTGPKDAWAAGDGGTVLHFDGKSWLAQKTGVEFGINGIWALDPKRVVAVGKDGRAAHFDGKTWREEATGVSQELKGVWGSGKTFIAVGRDGAVTRHDGSGWKPEPIASTPYLRAVGGTSLEQVFAVGTPGDPVYRHDGKSWEPMAAGTIESRRAISGSSRQIDLRGRRLRTALPLRRNAVGPRKAGCRSARPADSGTRREAR